MYKICSKERALLSSILVQLVRNMDGGQVHDSYDIVRCLMHLVSRIRKIQTPRELVNIRSQHNSHVCCERWAFPCLIGAQIYDALLKITLTRFPFFRKCLCFFPRIYDTMSQRNIKSNTEILFLCAKFSTFRSTFVIHKIFTHFYTFAKVSDSYMYLLKIYPKMPHSRLKQTNKRRHY